MPESGGLIDVGCPHCGKRLLVDAKYAGQRGKCKGCGHVVEVPSHTAVQHTGPTGLPLSKKDKAQASVVLCEKCGGDMVRDVVSGRNEGGLGCGGLLLVILFFPVSLLFLLAYLSRPKRKHIWKCSRCGYFYECVAPKKDNSIPIFITLAVMAIVAVIVVLPAIAWQVLSRMALAVMAIVAVILVLTCLDKGTRKDAGKEVPSSRKSSGTSKPPQAKLPIKPPSVSVFDQQQLDYFVGVACTHYAEADRIRRNIQGGNLRGNEKFEARAAEEIKKAEDAKLSWMTIQERCRPGLDRRQKEMEWEKSVVGMRNSNSGM